MLSLIAKPTFRAISGYLCLRQAIVLKIQTMKEAFQNRKKKQGGTLEFFLGLSTKFKLRSAIVKLVHGAISTS